MTAISINTNLANVVTPFVSSGQEDIANPINSSPLPPVQQSETIDRPINRTDRREQDSSQTAEPAEESSEQNPSAPREISSSPNPGELTEQELATIQKLRAVDSEVRAHELAHQAVGGQFAGSASFQYERGPDGNRYAVGGEVPIRLPTGEGDPQFRLRQAEQVIRAALAPAEPSSQDRQVAARAQQVKLDAQAEIRDQAGEDRDANSTSALADPTERELSNFIYPSPEAEAPRGEQVNTQV